MPVIDSYVIEMRRNGLAAGTIYKRQRCVELLADKHDLGSVSSEEIQAFLDARMFTSNRTRYCWLSHLGCFYTWAVAHEHLPLNPVARLQRPKLRRLVPDPTPEHEVRIAIAHAPTLLRQWVTLMAFAGLRCCEVAPLAGSDIDRSAGSVRVLGKGEKVRIVPMHPLVAAELAAAPARGHVFIDPGTGAPYTPGQVSKFVGRHLRACDCTHGTAHKLRHRFATMLLEAGVDIAVVAELLGHESMDTTRGYAAVSMRRMREAVLLLAG